MKTLAALILVLPTLAYAELVPGRSRPSAEGELTVKKADGIYEGAQKVTLTEYRTNAEGITHYTLNLGSTSENYQLIGIQAEGCGDRYFARAENEQAGRSELRLLNSLPRCRMAKEEWEVEITTHDPEQGTISTLEVAGDPEYFMLSQ
jgi:hypothetical protein